MRALILSVLLVGLGAASAQAEVWRTREGQCGEWRGRWTVDQGQDGTWTGEIEHELVGGPCAQGTGQTLRSSVRAVIVGENFFAVRQLPDGTALCNYYGQIAEDRVRGLELCETSTGRLNFALRFPPDGRDREARQRHETRRDDDWLDDPRNHDRRPADRGLRFDRDRP